MRWITWDDSSMVVDCGILHAEIHDFGPMGQNVASILSNNGDTIIRERSFSTEKQAKAWAEKVLAAETLKLVRKVHGRTAVILPLGEP